jgi:hypothetical protein
MYSTDLSKISLTEWEQILLCAQLLPSQRSILDNLTPNMQRLRDAGIKDVEELRLFLKKKGNYPAIAQDTGISEDYLIILNRMVNSYIVKRKPLPSLGLFDEEELNTLKVQGIKNTEQYYNALIPKTNIENVASQTRIPPDKLDYALHIVDLLRINGVGVEYAKMLYTIGVRSVANYNNTPSEAILTGINELNKERTYSKATLGISDVDYCRRFCEKLDCEIG